MQFLGFLFPHVVQKQQLECGPMPYVMAALPNIGGAICSTPQSLADAQYYRVPCSYAARTRNPLKLAGVPQTNETISAASIGQSSLYCRDMGGDIAA